MSPHSPPEDLYANGLNRHLFLPFVDVLTTFCRTHDMGSDNDFRLETTGREGVFFDASEDGQDTDALLEDAFAALVAGENEEGGQQEAQIVPTMFGRSISVARSHGRVCWLEFDQLCREDRGASDYAAICARFAAAALRMAAAPLCALQNGVFPTAPHRHPSNAQIFPLWWMMQ